MLIICFLLTDLEIETQEIKNVKQYKNLAAGKNSKRKNIQTSIKASIKPRIFSKNFLASPQPRKVAMASS